MELKTYDVYVISDGPNGVLRNRFLACAYEISDLQDLRIYDEEGDIATIARGGWNRIEEVKPSAGPVEVARR